MRKIGSVILVLVLIAGAISAQGKLKTIPTQAPATVAPTVAPTDAPVVNSSFEVKIELFNFKSDVKDAGGDAEFFGSLFVKLQEADVETNVGTLWSYSQSNNYVVSKSSNNNRSDVLTFTTPSLQGRILNVFANGIRENDTTGDDKFDDTTTAIKLDSLSAGVNTFNIRVNYSKSNKEYVEFSIRVTATPKA